MIIHKTKGDILIDDEDAALLNGWQIEIKNGYAILRKEQEEKHIRKGLSRIIMGEPFCLVVDHINHNTLDNRKCNLRICTRVENARNNKGHKNRKTSKYKGVTFLDRAKYFPSKPLGKQWRAYTRVNGRRIWFGYYATQEDAARGYNENAKRLFGEYAWLNVV